MAEDKMMTAVGGAAKGGILGVIIGGAAIFAALTLGVGLIGALGGAIGIGAGAGAAISTMFSGGALTWLAGAASVVGGIAYGTVPALIGGAFGLAHASDKINREAAREARKAHGHKHMQDKSFADGEIAGMQHTYQVMAAQVAQREQAAYQKGQQDVVAQIQQHAMQQMEAQQKESAVTAEAKPDGKSFAKLETKCTSKVEMVEKKRAEQATAINQMGA